MTPNVPYRWSKGGSSQHCRRTTSRPTRARGVSSLLAMLFLVLFGSLAVGFYSATTLSAQISKNERTQELARASTDSGMQFMRYQLGAMNLAYGTTSANLLANCATALGQLLNGTSNMGGNTVAVTSGAIYIPSQTGWITSDAGLGTKFQASITQVPNQMILVVTVHGGSTANSLVRGAQLQFQPSQGKFALMGLNSMSMSSNAFTDSYDASKGAYVAANAHKNGSIASNGNITLSNTAKVNGNAMAGIGKTVTIQNSASVTGATGSLGSALSFPSVTLPATYTDLGDVNLSSGTSSLPGGTYLIHHLTLSGTAHFTWGGPVKLYIQNSYTVTQGAQIDTYQNLPANRTLYFLPTCTTATWSGTNVCVGELYAPNTDFTISGSVEMFGRITAHSIVNSSSGGMHSDESLPAPGGSGPFSPVQGSYIEVP